MNAQSDEAFLGTSYTWVIGWGIRINHYKWLFLVTIEVYSVDCYDLDLIDVFNLYSICRHLQVDGIQGLDVSMEERSPIYSELRLHLISSCSPSAISTITSLWMKFHSPIRLLITSLTSLKPGM